MDTVPQSIIDAINAPHVEVPECLENAFGYSDLNEQDQAEVLEFYYFLKSLNPLAVPS